MFFQYTFMIYTSITKISRRLCLLTCEENILLLFFISNNGLSLRLILTTDQLLNVRSHLFLTYKLYHFRVQIHL